MIRTLADLLPANAWAWLLAGPCLLLLLPLGLSELVLWYRLSKTAGVRAPLVAKTPVHAIVTLITAFRMQMRDRLPEHFGTYFDQLGPSDFRCVELYAAGERVVFTEEPEHIKTVLSSSFSKFGKGEKLLKAFGPFLGYAVFTADGQVWHQSRGMLRALLTKERIQDMEMFDRRTQAFLAQLPSSGETVDINELLYRFAMDVTTSFLLGESVGSLEDPENEFAEAFNSVSREATTIFFMGPLAALYPKGAYKRGVKTIDAFIQPFVEATLALPPGELEKMSNSDKEFTFLHNLALFTRDRTVIRDQIVSLLMAGRDTSASTLSWMIYQLSEHPKVWAKLRAMVLDRIGPTERPTVRDLKDFGYLTNCVNETMRLHPVLFSNSRVAMCNTTLPGRPGEPDIAILKGDAICMNYWAMMRRKEMYPPVSDTFADPAVWSPERWDVWQPKPWEFVPFNGGPRTCIGQEFAMLEIGFLMVRLLQKYESIEYRGDWGAQFYRVDLVGRPGKGVPVALFEAQSD